MALDGIQNVPGKGHILVRYADDFVVTGKDPQSLQQVIPKLTEFHYVGLEAYRLIFGKLVLSHFLLAQGFDFLGLTFREYPENAFQNYRL
jgi:RNA-directed DNA polymerase